MNVGLIVAAGAGTRMRGKVRKQYLPLAGRPVLSYSLAAFGACRDIASIILVVPAEDLSTVRRDIVQPLRLNMPVDLVPGGQERQHSVYNGLKRVQGDSRMAVIHDGVRPFIQPEQISACIRKAEQTGACILGIPALDTLKQVSASGQIEATLDRRRIWLAQTPQAFRLELIKEAHERARQQGVTETDDAALVERLGVSVSILMGRKENIKITLPEDLPLAEAVLETIEKEKRHNGVRLAPSAMPPS
jgi:2-C-methyl-D-erythritol 4-phosphate cytidylyltransferase